MCRQLNRGSRNLPCDLLHPIGVILHSNRVVSAMHSNLEPSRGLLAKPFGRKSKGVVCIKHPILFFFLGNLERGEGRWWAVIGGSGGVLSGWLQIQLLRPNPPSRSNDKCFWESP